MVLQVFLRCLFIGMFRPFVFNVIIDMIQFQSVILFYIFLIFFFISLPIPPSPLPLLVIFSTSYIESKIQHIKIITVFFSCGQVEDPFLSQISGCGVDIWNEVFLTDGLGHDSCHEQYEVIVCATKPHSVGYTVG